MLDECTIFMVELMKGEPVILTEYLHNYHRECLVLYFKTKRVCCVCCVCRAELTV